MEVDATLIVTLLLAVPLAPTHVNLYVVVTPSGGVVYMPDVVLMPTGEEEHEVLSGEDQMIVAVLLYPTSVGVAERLIAGPLEVLEAAVPIPPEGPPHEVNSKLNKIIAGHSLLALGFICAPS